MRSLDPNSNICRQNTSCHSGQASCHDSVKLRLSEGCEKWSDQQRCLSLENNYSVARLKLKAKDLCKMKVAFISGGEISKSYLSNENVSGSWERLGSRSSHSDLHKPGNLRYDQRHYTQVVQHRDERTEENYHREDLDRHFKQDQLTSLTMVYQN